MTSAPQIGAEKGGAPRDKAKSRTPSFSKLLKKDGNFARKNVMLNEKKSLGDGKCEVFESVRAAQQARPPPPPPITVAYPPEEERPGRIQAPYAWFREDSPKRPRKPLLEVLSPARNPSGMKVTEIKPDMRAIERQHALNEQYAARGRRMMDSNVFSLAQPDPLRSKENR